MRRRYAPLHALVVLAAALALTACGDDEETTTTATEATTTEVTTTAETTTESTTTDETSGELPAIVVDSPSPGDTVTSPVTVAGTANVFEANVSIAIEDAEGNEITSTFTTASCGTGCRGDYSEDVEFSVDAETDATIVVFESSAKDGSRQKVVEVPVTLEP